MPNITKIGGNSEDDEKIFAYNSKNLNKIELENIIADNIRLRIPLNMDKTKITLTAPNNSEALIKLFNYFNVKDQNE